MSDFEKDVDMLEEHDLTKLYRYSGTGFMREPKSLKYQVAHFAMGGRSCKTDFSSSPYSIEVIHRKGYMHLVSQLWLFREVDGKMQVLLRKRPVLDLFHPERYDCAIHQHFPFCSEHPSFIYDRLRIELGVTATALSYAGDTFSKNTCIWGEKPWIDQEYKRIYIGAVSFDENQFKVNPRYGSDVKWVWLDDLFQTAYRNSLSTCFQMEDLQVAVKMLEAKRIRMFRLPRIPI